MFQKCYYHLIWLTLDICNFKYAGCWLPPVQNKYKYSIKTSLLNANRESLSSYLNFLNCITMEKKVHLIEIISYLFAYQKYWFSKWKHYFHILRKITIKIYGRSSSRLVRVNENSGETIMKSVNLLLSMVLCHYMPNSSVPWFVIKLDCVDLRG